MRSTKEGHAAVISGLGFSGLLASLAFITWHGELSYLLGMITGVLAVLTAWMSEKAFGKWYRAGLLLLNLWKPEERAEIG